MLVALAASIPAIAQNDSVALREIVVTGTRNATDVYGVDGIPQILLIGKDGVIIARDLRGEDIEKAVKKALGK